MTEKVITWSHSALKDYEGCARRFHEVKVLNKYPFQDTQQTRYGKDLHTAAELYVKDGTPLPEHFVFVKDVLDSLMAKPGRKYPEYEMALTTDLTPVAFSSEKRWVRGIADLIIVNDDNFTAHVIDYKTGNNKYADPKQLRLMALMAYAHFPKVQRIKAGLLFILRNSFVNEEYTREDMDKLWADFMPNLTRLELSYKSNTWNPQPSGLCGWCPVDNCKFYKER